MNPVLENDIGATGVVKSMNKVDIMNKYSKYDFSLQKSDVIFQ